MMWDRTTVWFIKIPVVYKSHDEDRRLAAIYALLDRYGIGHEIELPTSPTVRRSCSN